ncbi:MAG TPA: protein translocase subunit SecD, partial [Bacteroidia bacterium]|nr:protein translocase subunit SecD [Bacteroidia bacterium]
LKEEASQSVDRVFQIIQARIDQFGVTQPTVQLLANSGRVMVELPGVDNPDRVRRLLQNTAKLEFWNVYSNFDFYPYREKINSALKAKHENDSLTALGTASATLSTDSNAVAPADGTAVASNDTAKLNGTVDSTMAAAGDSAIQDSAAQANTRDLLFEAGLYPNIYQDENQQYQLSQDAAIGIALGQDTAKINKILASTEVRDELPTDLVFAWASKPIEDGGGYQLYALKTEREGGAALEGDVVSDARATVGQAGTFEITMYMNLAGAGKWEKITDEASKNNPKKAVAIVLDGQVYSAPTVQNKIGGGVSSITGNFTQEEAKDLANILKAGSLPARATIVEEAVVGPSLGQAAINAGIISILVGFLAVIVLMYAFYNTAGIIADLAVLLNLFFIIGTLASFGAALTLPGIAGIILTLGMAVDANVLIYERVKEELDAGRNLRNAISVGFKNASSAIIDGNLTTLLAGIVLYIFGSGPIAGFAITLIIGIVSSLFTAFLLTRVVFEWIMKREKNVTFWFPFSRNILRNANFDFIGKRKIFYTISAVIILAGTVSMFTRGFDLGVDFEGGWSYVIEFDKKVEATETRNQLATALGSAPEVKVYGTDGQTLKITTTYLINSTDPNADDQVLAKLDEGFKAMGVGSYEVQTSYKVGPTVAEDIRNDAIISIVIALIGMFIYIQARFKRWQFGLATVVMLVHDVLLVLSLFSLLNGVVPFTLEIDQAFIAAILTIIGYSINDSVVVFDRVREYLRDHKREGNTHHVINMALNSTLSRTIMTSLTTVIVVLILFLFGGETIRGFAFALTVGIILGTYSSLCIGSPLSADLIGKEAKEEEKEPAQVV